MPKWTPSGVYPYKSMVENAALYWQNQGFKVMVRKVNGGWVHYRRRK